MRPCQPRGSAQPLHGHRLDHTALTTPLTPPPPSAHTLRAHLADVSRQREDIERLGLGDALAAIRHIQVQRFRLTYADLLVDPRHARATRFFLAELYGAQDYAARDAQFARIAGAIERLFPPKVMALAVELAQVHALTEELDCTMARCWRELKLPRQPKGPALARGYVACWARTGRPDDRQHQLDTVLRLGERLAEVVRVPGLRLALRMMRGPAHAAGLADLQAVLEEGFDAFKSIGEADTFLSAVRERESQWLDTLFHHPDAATTQLARAHVLSATTP